jgi:hypothetical protein
MIDWKGGKDALRWTAARRFQSGPRKTHDSRKTAARAVALVVGSVRAL